MPTPAQNYFGFATRPLSSYFPSSMPIPDSVAAIGPYNPIAELQRQQEAQAVGDLLADDFSGPEALPAIQRLVAAGSMTPQQGGSIARLQRVQQPRVTTGMIPQSVALGIQKLSMIRPDDEDAADRFQQVVEQSPELFQSQAGVAAVSKFQQALVKNAGRPQMARNDLSALTKEYGSFKREISDQDKLAAFAKARDKATPQNSEDWRASHHLVRDKPASTLAAHLDAIERLSGRPLSPDLEAMRQEANTYLGVTPMTPNSPLPQTTERVQAIAPAQVHILYLQQHPETARKFDAKFGSGAAARVLGQ